MSGTGNPMDLTALLLFAGIYFVAVASPGPGIAAVIARGLGRGLAGGPAFIAGFVVGDLIWFAVAATGLSVIATAYAPLFTAIKYAGCAYLLWLAWRIWNAPATAPGAPEGAALRGTDLGAFLGSLALTLGNPKVIVFFLSIMPLVIDVNDISPLAFAELAAIIVVVLSTILLTALLLADRARRLFASPQAVRRMNRTTAGMMAGVAALIAAR